jgi:UrcA family protein
MYKRAGTLFNRGPVIVALLLPLWSDPVAAEGPPYSATIQFSDLDLSADAGIQVLYQRINDAAHHVCYRETSQHPGIDQQVRYVACFEDAIASAVKQVHQERLTALYRAQSRLAAN